MKIAIIPWDDTFLGDKMFDLADKQINYDHRMEQFFLMRREFERRGDELHTVDLFEDPKEVDFFLFFEWNAEWLRKLTGLKLDSRMVYCNAEPPTVNPLNCREGFEKLFHYFPYVMTWNDALVDNRRIFKRNIPYYFDVNLGDVPFEKRKLLTCISGNKHSDHPDELYSERERAIFGIEKIAPEDFDLYGGGWDTNVHPSYRGRVEKKAAVYHQYRFALALENMQNVKGYVSEKILDCLTTGIVPVYKGADNIVEYVPEECFIRYERFGSAGEMLDFLRKMDKEEYEGYLAAAQKFLKSDMVKRFAGEEYARNVYELIAQAAMKDFKVGWTDKRKLDLETAKQRVKAGVRKLVKR